MLSKLPVMASKPVAYIMMSNSYSFSLGFGDLERAARVGCVDEAGKGLLAAGEHLGVAGLDLGLRRRIDLAVVQRRAPVRRALENGEAADFGSDGLDGLHAGGAGADHGDALA